MKPGIAALALAVSLTALPATAHSPLRDFRGFSTPATVTGKWVLTPRACPDLREDRRDARVDEGRRDRREDRRDRRVLDCPPKSWTFVADPGQTPGPIRLGRRGGHGHWHGHGHGRGHGKQDYYGTSTPAPTYTPPTYQDAGYGTTTPPASGCFTINKRGRYIPTPCY